MDIKIFYVYNFDDKFTVPKYKHDIIFINLLNELIPLMVDMAINNITGTVNLTNPGLISHNEILEMYKEIVDPDFTWNNFTIDEQNAILASGRSNNYLDTSKLESYYPALMNIKDSVRKILIQMKENKDNAEC